MPIEEVRHAILLVGAVLFGDAVFGGRIRRALALPDGEDERRAFHAWFVVRLPPTRLR